MWPGNRLALRLTIEIDDLARFAGDAARAARIVGWVDCDVLGSRLPIERGVFNLLVGAVDADRREMRYRLFFRDGVGHAVTLAGEKLVGGPGLRVSPETTTLPVRLRRGWAEAGEKDHAELVASGIVRLRPIDFARQLASFRSTGRSPAACWAAAGSPVRPTSVEQLGTHLGLRVPGIGRLGYVIRFPMECRCPKIMQPTRASVPPASMRSIFADTSTAHRFADDSNSTVGHLAHLPRAKDLPDRRRLRIDRRQQLRCPV